MKSVLVVAVLFGVLITLSQGTPLKAHKTQLLNKCQEKKIDKLIDKIIDDTYALKADAYEAYENAYSGVLECVVTSFTTLVTCVKGVLMDNLEDLQDDLEVYETTVEALVQKIVEDIQDCV